MTSKSGRLKVLVIDDDDIARELLNCILTDEGHEVVELPSAIGASGHVNQHGIDAVVLDVMMPDINGDKLAKLLRKNARGEALAIVLVSSRPLQELEELALAAGADGVLQKQYIRSHLASTVQSAYRSRSRTPRSRTK